MQQVMTSIPAQKSPVHPPPATATVADVMRTPPTTVQQHDHVAAAAYLMKHAGTTALMVVHAQTGQPAGIITQADIARAIADGKDVNDAWADAVTTTRPALITTTSIRDAATIMTADRRRRGMTRAPGRSGRAAPPGWCTHNRHPAPARPSALSRRRRRTTRSRTPGLLNPIPPACHQACPLPDGRPRQAT